ncbi:MAG: hypothetical protein AB7N65_03740, partial [Vicinamibacterales bacterium]
AVRALTLPFYAGTLSRAPHLIAPGPLNTDDFPAVEYAAPITQRQQSAGAVKWFTSQALIQFFEALLQAVPPAQDPYLSQLVASEREWVQAGYHYHAASVYRALGRQALADSHRAAFETRVPATFRLPRQVEPSDRQDEWDRDR